MTKNKEQSDDYMAGVIAARMAAAEQIILPAVLQCNHFGIPDAVVVYSLIDIAKGIVEYMQEMGVRTKDGLEFNWESITSDYEKTFPKSAFKMALGKNFEQKKKEDNNAGTEKHKESKPAEGKTN